MRISHSVFIVATFLSPVAVCVSQSAPKAVSTQDTPAAPLAPSGLLQTSLNAVETTLGGLRLERWKKGTVRDEASENIGEIQRELKETLPSLLQQADAAPGILSGELPVSRHVNALYDVLLRVVEAARVSAPPEQVTQLEQALTALGNARKALDERMQRAAAAQEKQLSDLRSTLQAQASVRCPVTPAPVTPSCVPQTPAHKVRKKPKPPATTPQVSPATTPGTPAGK
jgi:hypothetical protein